MPTPAELLAESLQALRDAKRFSHTSNSYRKDNPGEYAKVIAYLDGGERPTGVTTEMGKHALLEEDARRALAPVPPPTGVKLRWAPPPLSSPVTRIFGPVPSGSGQDLKLTPAQITGHIGEVKGYNDVVMIGGEIAGGTGGITGHIIPRENTGTFHIEGVKVALTDRADAYAVRWRQPILQIQNCWIEVTDAGGSFHADAFQTQEAEINDLRFDRCTIKTDYQGIFTSNEPNTRPGGRSKVSKTVLSRLLFLPGTQGFPATFYFKAFPPRPGTDPIGPCEFYDVWMPELNAPNKVYPNGTNWTGWDGSANRYGCFLESKQHANGQTYPFLRFSKPSDTVPAGGAKGQSCGDCQIGGDGGIWLGTPPANLNVGCASDSGMQYVSPGYV